MVKLSSLCSFTGFTESSEAIVQNETSKASEIIDPRDTVEVGMEASASEPSRQQDTIVEETSRASSAHHEIVDPRDTVEVRMEASNTSNCSLLICARSLLGSVRPGKDVV